MRLVMLVSILAVAQFAVAADDDAEARKKLVGVWKGRVKNGAQGHEITFTTKLILGKRNEKDLGEGSFTLDLTTKPFRMDATRSTSGKKKQIYLGIYSIEGDNLKWCVSTKKERRPTKFVTSSRDGQFCLVLKRQKKD